LCERDGLWGDGVCINEKVAVSFKKMQLFFASENFWRCRDLNCYFIKQNNWLSIIICDII
jgi:hypothetical protein